MGTLFRIFPQTPTGNSGVSAEIVEVSSPAGSLAPGPSDDRMYVIFPEFKPKEYGLHTDEYGRPFVYLPPWNGPIYAPAVPDDEGNFLHYTDIEDPCFHAAHTFACIRFTLDCWERYYGRRIEWYFRDYYNQAEIVIIPQFENAQIGRGFIEIGTDVNETDGTESPFTLNFDVIAHEIGHGLLFAEVGEPALDRETAEYLGFQESSADIVSMIAIMHFDSVVDQVLESTAGNLYMANNLNRFAETSPVEQIRMAANNLKLSDFSAGWKDSHRLAQPLTGAVFDILVDIFHEELVRKKAMSTTLEQLSDMLEGSNDYEVQLQDDFDHAYASNPAAFRDALLFARDALANLLMETWSRLTPDDFHYTDFYIAMLKADLSLFDGRYQNIIQVNFEWRHIGVATVGPRLPKDDKDQPVFRGHKDKKHTIDGLNENLLPVPDPYIGAGPVCSHKTRRKKTYAERYRESRVLRGSASLDVRSLTEVRQYD